MTCKQQKRLKKTIYGDKDKKSLYKSMNNAVYSKTMVNLRSRNDLTCKQQKRLFKMDTKANLYVT